MSRLGLLTTLHRYQFRPTYRPKPLQLAIKRFRYPVYSEMISDTNWYYSVDYLWDINQYKYSLTLICEHKIHGSQKYQLIFRVTFGKMVILHRVYDINPYRLRHVYPNIMYVNKFKLRPLYKYHSIPYLSTVINDLIRVQKL
jgi:hypothetical protein